MTYIIHPTYEHIKKFILSIPISFQKEKSTIHNARNVIKVLNYQEKSYVVKSFKVPHLLNRIVYSLFRNSKAKKSYENSLKILDFVPAPIAYIEKKKSTLIHQSFFISEHFKYDFTIREPMHDTNIKDTLAIFKQFAEFTYKLHNQGVLHLDYSPGNILIKKEKDNYIFKIVDINRMEFKTLTLDERLQNFSKLWAKDEDMKVIIKEYAKLMDADENYCIDKAIAYSQKNKDIKNFKKRLKGKKVHD